MPIVAALSDQANQPVKKKLKLKKFEDNLTTTKHEPDYTESYFDHSLFNNYQLANSGPIKSQFIDQATEAELLDIEQTDTLASTIKEQQLKTKPKLKSVMPTTTTKLPQITNPVNYDFDTLGTDLDLDNLFESDENSNDCHMTDVQNVIKLEARPSTHSWNLEYQQQTSEEFLNLGSVKVALKTLMVSTAAAAVAVAVTKDDDTNHGQTSRMDTTTSFEDTHKSNETTGFRLPSPASSENMSTASKTVLATNFSSSDSLANITSTTQLTPPSPSPPSSQQGTTNANSAVVPVASNDQQVKDVNAQSQQQQALNKITLLSSSQTNGFNSQLNKVLIEY